MLSKVLASLLLAAACVHYGATDTVYTQQSWPEPLGSCVSANCHPPTSKGIIDLECDRKYTVGGEKKSDTIYLKAIGDRYQLTDAKGIPSGKTMKVDNKDDIAKFSRFDESGKLEEICCATKSINIDETVKGNLKKFCNEKEMKDNDNKNC